MSGPIIFPTNPPRLPGFGPYNPYHNFYDNEVDQDYSSEVFITTKRALHEAPTKPSTGTSSTSTPTRNPAVSHSHQTSSAPRNPVHNHGVDEDNTANTTNSTTPHGGLSTTARAFIGISAFILLGVIVAGIYFYWKSKRTKSQHGHHQPTKGRGVTRPSFLPSHNHQIKFTTHNVMTESVHLEIPSPEWQMLNYPIVTPYTFPSTSTVSQLESEPRQSNECPKTKDGFLCPDTGASKEQPQPPIKSQPPVKPTRIMKPVNLTLHGNGDLPAQRFTVQ